MKIVGHKKQRRRVSMQLNRSTDYAIQMLLYLAKAGKTVSSSKLAAAIGVSHRYLLQISAKLRGRCKIERSMEQRLRFYALKTENGLRRVRNPWYN